MSRLYARIVESGLMKKSTMDLIWGDPGSKEYPLNQILSLPKTMHGLCVVYSSFIQLKLIERSVLLSNTVYDNCGERVGNTLKRMWSGNFDMASDQNVFSFLKDCASDPDLSDLFGDSVDAVKNVLEEVNREYAGYLNKSFKTNPPLNLFVNLVRCLSLFKTLEIDDESKEISFDGVAFMPYTPLFFIFSDIDGQTKKTMCVLSSVYCGEQNNLLNFVLFKAFHNISSEKSQYIEARVTVANDERMRMVCKVFNMDTEWFDREDYLGDCLFVVKLSEVLAEIIKRDLIEEKGYVNDVFDSVKKYFENTALAEDLNSKSMTINSEGASDTNKYALQNLMMGLIIMNGAFTTTYCLLHGGKYVVGKDPNDMSHKLFTIATDYIREKGYCDDIDSRLNRRSVDIDTHKSQLRQILLPKTKSYGLRIEQIYAEQEAKCIIEMIGVEKNNLFADQEQMLSIYDYFDMVSNNTLDLKQLLHNVVIFTMKFYSALTGAPVVEPPTIEPADSIAALRDYCTILQDENSDYKRILDSAIGRDICRIDTFNKYIRNFETIEDWTGDGIRKMTSKFFFVSYSHGDQVKVKAFVNYWKSKGYNLFIDEKKFELGDDWEIVAYKAIVDENCEGELAFTSETSSTSKAVAYELQIASVEAKARKCVDPDFNVDRFIIPIMTEEGTIAALFERKLSDRTLSEESRHYLNVCAGHIPSTKIFVNMNNDASIEKLMSSRLSDTNAVLDFDSMSAAELAVDSFLAFLKTGSFYWFENNAEVKDLRKIIDGNDVDTTRRIYPFLISVKETRIKRDDVTIMGYEIVNGKGKENLGNRVMLSSKKIPADDYYCVPNYRSCGECGGWMVNPALISFEELRRS